MNKHFFLIYLTKVVGILTGFLNVFLVVPNLTANPAIYGVYSVCVSLGLFFSYADIGFLSSCQKYATQCLVNNEKEEEIKIIAFSIFTLAIFIAIISFFLSLIAISPGFLISSGSAYELKTASTLLYILILFSPNILIQKFVYLVFSIRYQDYIYQFIDIVFNIIKILIISLFINEAKYDITGYFLSLQVLTLLSGIVSLIVIFKLYNYNFGYFFKYFRFSKEVYRLTKDLAFSTLLLTIAWILYFEMNTVIISKYYGVLAVSYYSASLVIVNFIRSLYNVMYSPYTIEFFRYTAENDIEGLKDSLSRLIKWTYPLIIIPTIILISQMELIMFIWLGNNFSEAIVISRIMAVTIALSATSIPLSFYFMANSVNRIMRNLAFILPIVFYVSLVIFNFFVFNSLSVAYATLITFATSSIYYIWTIIEMGGEKIIYLYTYLLKKFTAPFVVGFIFLYFIPDFNFSQNFIIDYIKLGFRIFILTLIPLLIYFFPDLRVLLVSKYRRLS